MNAESLSKTPAASKPVTRRKVSVEAKLAERTLRRIADELADLAKNSEPGPPQITFAARDLQARVEVACKLILAL